MPNSVDFKHYIDAWPGPIGDLFTAAAHITTPGGKCFLVVFHSKGTLEGWDLLEIRRLDANGDAEEITCIGDKHEDDYFASEMFGLLSGKFPYEIEETVKPEIIHHTMRELDDEY